MKLKLISDIHCEFHTDRGVSWINALDNTQTDVLVIAGDLGTTFYLQSAIRIFCERFSHVIYVSGNHDHYYSSFNEVRALLHEIKYDNFHYLDNSTININGQRFVGTTLWFRDDTTNVIYSSGMSDFHVIKDIQTHVYSENAKAIKFLSNNIKANDIVITHHLPSYKSIDTRFRDSNLNRFFVCDMTDVILNSKPAYWLHGHTHQVCDYMLGNTRILCNPFGYMHEYTGFDDSFLLEI